MNKKMKTEVCLNIKTVLAIFHRELLDIFTTESGSKAISEAKSLKHNIKKLETSFQKTKCSGDVEFTRPFSNNILKVGGKIKKKRKIKTTKK